MKYLPECWSEKHKSLSKTIRKADLFEENIDRIYELHEALHCSCVYANNVKNPVDMLWENPQADTNSFINVQNRKKLSVCWSLWHIARIEDITMNILVANGKQVFNEDWKTRIGADITDTGNAMTTDEIIAFGEKINPTELKKYRDEVGKRSREILHKLTPEDMKRKFPAESVQRIFDEGGLTSQGESAWLADFWGKKDVAGIILMPLTRHQTMHLNDCFAWKEKGLKK